MLLGTLCLQSSETKDADLNAHACVKLGAARIRYPEQNQDKYRAVRLKRSKGTTELMLSQQCYNTAAIKSRVLFLTH